MKGQTTQEDLDKAYKELDVASTPEAQKKAKAKNTWRIVSNVAFVVILVLVFVSLVFIQTTKEKGNSISIAGFSMYYVKTESMDPTLPVGTIILSKSVTDTSTLKEGDIVTFYWDESKTTIVTHRIVSIIDIDGEIAYRTKGDNSKNDMDPMPLTQDRVISIMIRKLF